MALKRLFFLFLFFWQSALSAQTFNCAFRTDLSVNLEDSCQYTLTLNDVLSNLNTGDCTTANTSSWVIVARDSFLLDSLGNRVPFPTFEQINNSVGIYSFTGFQWSIVDTVGNFVYDAFSYNASNLSWSYVGTGRFTAEDNIDAYFCCITDTLDQYGAFRSVYYSQIDTMKLGSGQFKPGLSSAWKSTQDSGKAYTWPDNNLRYFDTVIFKPIISGIYTFHIGPIDTNGLQGPKFNPAVAVYRGNFNRDNPGENLVNFSASTFSANPAGGLGMELYSTAGYFGLDNVRDTLSPWAQYKFPITRLSLPLTAGDNYTFVVTHLDPSLTLGTTDSTEFFRLFMVLDSYSSVTASPGIFMQKIDSVTRDLPVLRAIQYHDFLQGDLDSVKLNQTVFQNHAQYQAGGQLLAADQCNVWTTAGLNLVGIPANDEVAEDILDYSYLFNQSISLTDLMFYRYGFKPYVIENCEKYEVAIQDSIAKEGGDIGRPGDDFGLPALNLVSHTITRSFEVNDYNPKNDTASCAVRMIFQNPDLGDVILPHFTYNIDCDDFYALNSSFILPNGNPSPELSGYPYLITLLGTKALSPRYANLSAAYNDQAKVNLCGGTRNFSFTRVWTITDDAKPGTNIIYNQIIRVYDFTPPVIVPSLPVVVNDSMDCRATVTIKRPEITETCHDSINLKLYVTDFRGKDLYANLNFNDDSVVVELPSDTFLVRYIATDSCNNMTNHTDSIIVNFKICKDTTINISSSGEVNLTGLDLFIGDMESCGIVSIQLDTTNFTTSGTKTVTSTYTYLDGSISTCVSQVEIIDSEGPSLFLDNAFSPSLDGFGSLNLSVMDLVASAFDNKTSFGNLWFSFESDSHVTNKILSCSDVGQMNLTVHVKDEAGNMTQKSITINISDTGGACHCYATNLYLSSSGLTERLYSVSDRIIALNTIATGKRMEYKASNSITLRPGFTVQAGAEFKASIGGCQVPQAQASMLNSVHEEMAPEFFKKQSDEIREVQQETEIQEESSLKVYPNPTTGTFNLELSYFGFGKVAEFRVVNLFGQPVWRTQWSVINGFDHRIFDLSHLPAGTYAYVLVVDGSRISGSQLIIMRR
jgi:hypothetical protein